MGPADLRAARALQERNARPGSPAPARSQPNPQPRLSADPLLQALGTLKTGSPQDLLALENACAHWSPLPGHGDEQTFAAFLLVLIKFDPASKFQARYVDQVCALLSPRVANPNKDAARAIFKADMRRLEAQDLRALSEAASFRLQDGFLAGFLKDIAACASAEIMDRAENL